MYKEETHYARHRKEILEKLKTCREQPDVKEKANSYAKQWRMSHPDYLRDWRENNPGYFTEHQRELTKEVLIHYGKGKLTCVVCGNNDARVLSIDHIYNNGGKHRKEMAKQLGYVKNFHQWLKKQNYPDGYQTLCMNCQWIKNYEFSKMT